MDGNYKAWYDGFSLLVSGNRDSVAVYEVIGTLFQHGSDML